MVDKPHPLLTVDQQIEHMRANGVKFEIMNESDAKSYLRTNNNYFRLRSYRHGFERVSDGPNRGKYVNLDFAMLTDLATIDMHLRYQMGTAVGILDQDHPMLLGPNPFDTAWGSCNPGRPLS